MKCPKPYHFFTNEAQMLEGNMSLSFLDYLRKAIVSWQLTKELRTLLIGIITKRPPTSRPMSMTMDTVITVAMEIFKNLLHLLIPLHGMENESS